VVERDLSLQQTKAVRVPKADAALILDDTLCEHVGSLFEYVDRHYNHGDDTYPLAHNPVTSHYVSGPVRFPVDLDYIGAMKSAPSGKRLSRHTSPTVSFRPRKRNGRASIRSAPVLLEDPDFQKLHQQFRTKIDLGIELLEAAMWHKVAVWSPLVRQLVSRRRTGVHGALPEKRLDQLAEEKSESGDQQLRPQGCGRANPSGWRGHTLPWKIWCHFIPPPHTTP